MFAASASGALIPLQDTSMVSASCKTIRTMPRTVLLAHAITALTALPGQEVVLPSYSFFRLGDPLWITYPRWCLVFSSSSLLRSGGAKQIAILHARKGIAIRSLVSVSANSLSIHSERASRSSLKGAAGARPLTNGSGTASMQPSGSFRYTKQMVIPIATFRGSNIHPTVQGRTLGMHGLSA